MSSACSTAENIVEDIYGVLLQLYRVSEWSDSRWIGVSRTSREMITALFLGLDNVFKVCTAEGTQVFFAAQLRQVGAQHSASLRNGWLRLVSHLLLLEILWEDDHLVLVSHMIDEDLEGEVGLILNARPELWAFFPIRVVFQLPKWCSLEVATV